eukprot:TRINITY_DN19810_c0_g1_i3.p1 TRINITY_DN19810_c0_g1~~TRINITY_DN19810_c0_g1_i3.p1  ORF type:complete len:429 (-),score=64.83 TRINITY_DN19810_c0_g1_i3:377-1663(-)
MLSGKGNNWTRSSRWLKHQDCHNLCRVIASKRQNGAFFGAVCNILSDQVAQFLQPPDFLAAASRGAGGITLYDLNSLQELAKFRNYNTSPCCIAVAPGGGHLYVSRNNLWDYDPEIVCFETGSMSLVNLACKLNGFKVVCMTVSPDGKSLVVACAKDGFNAHCCIIRVETNSLRKKAAATCFKTAGSIGDVKYTPAGDKVVAVWPNFELNDIQRDLRVLQADTLEVLTRIDLNAGSWSQLDLLFLKQIINQRGKEALLLYSLGAYEVKWLEVEELWSNDYETPQELFEAATNTVSIGYVPEDGGHISSIAFTGENIAIGYTNVQLRLIGIASSALVAAVTLDYAGPFTGPLTLEHVPCQNLIVALKHGDCIYLLRATDLEVLQQIASPATSRFALDPFLHMDQIFSHTRASEDVIQSVVFDEPAASRY